MTSSAASETDSARNCGASVAVTSPTPAHHLGAAAAGQVHVEQDDVGQRLARCAATASSTSAASPTTSTRRRPSSARTPARNMAWSSTITYADVAVAHDVLSPLVEPRNGIGQLHLGALAGRGPDLARCRRGAHPADDRSRTPCRSAGTSVGVEARAAVADEDLDGRPRPPRSRASTAGLRVLGRVDQWPRGWPRPGRQGRRRASQSPTETSSTVDPVACPRPRRRLPRSAATGCRRRRRRSVQPGPQVALLGAGEPGDRGGVVGVLLDQGQRLEHRVVQVGGQVGPLLGAHPLRPLGGQVGGEPVDPGPQDDGQPDDTDAGRDQHVVDVGEAAVPDREEHDGPDHQDDTGADAEVGRPAAGAEDGADRVEPLGLVEPPGPLGLVGLAPQQADADDREDDRPQQDAAAAEDRLGQQDQADAEREEGDGRPRVRQPADPARATAAAGGRLEPGRADLDHRLRGQQQPETGVEQDPRAAEHGGDQERDPDPDHGQREVARQAGGHAADDRLAGVPRGPAHVTGHVAARHDARHGARRWRAGRRSWCFHRRRAPPRRPRGSTPVDPEPGAPGRGPGQGFPRWCTTVRCSTVDP